MGVRSFFVTRAQLFFIVRFKICLFYICLKLFMSLSSIQRLCLSLVSNHSTLNSKLFLHLGCKDGQVTLSQLCSDLFLECYASFKITTVGHFGFESSFQ